MAVIRMMARDADARDADGAADTETRRGSSPLTAERLFAADTEADSLFGVPLQCLKAAVT
jgi:hypothetical protein